MSDLKDLCIDQLRDIHSACRQSRDVTIEPENAATDDDLKQALHAGHKGISTGITVLEELIRGHGASPEGEHCNGME